MTEEVVFGHCPRCGAEYHGSTGCPYTGPVQVGVKSVQEQILDELKALRQDMAQVRWELEHARLAR